VPYPPRSLRDAIWKKKTYPRCRIAEPFGPRDGKPFFVGRRSGPRGVAAMRRQGKVPCARKAGPRTVFTGSGQEENCLGFGDRFWDEGPSNRTKIRPYEWEPSWGGVGDSAELNQKIRHIRVPACRLGPKLGQGGPNFSSRLTRPKKKPLFFLGSGDEAHALNQANEGHALDS